MSLWWFVSLYRAQSQAETRPARAGEKGVN